MNQSNKNRTERSKGWLLPVLCRECLVVLVFVLVVSEIDINPEGWMEGGQAWGSPASLIPGIPGWLARKGTGGGCTSPVKTAVARQRGFGRRGGRGARGARGARGGKRSTHTPTDTAACPESHGQSYASEELFVTNAINQLSAAHCFQ